ncbi:SusC/RagA family TonB-linked outer membrane protein [Rhizosphaericola mali]|nr:SusC/RagA family TonB-linked outer membrane protein [Rhizosphaericola mali]
MLLLFLFGCFTNINGQQSKTVTGVVLNEKNEPLEGVTVASGKRSTTTSEDGHFQLTLPLSSTKIVFHLVGFDSKNLEIQPEMKVIMTTVKSDVSEIVVVGYGTQKKSTIAGSISSIKGSVIEDQPVTSFDAALTGQAPGVQITSANGVVNNPPVFRIRGTNSISLSSYPLIVIDGVPTFTAENSMSNTDAANNPLSSVNMDDIESINVLKDAAATAIYGSRAANGVVLITTKRGKLGNAKVNYDVWAGIVKPYRMWQAVSGQQMMEIKNEALENAGQADAFFPSYDASGNVISTNWNDYLYRTGYSNNHTVSVSGGTEKTKYYISAGYSNQAGIIRKNGFERKNVRFNLDHRASRILSLGINGSYSNENNTAALSSGSVSGAAFASYGIGRLGISLPTNISPYNLDGSYNINGTALGSGNNTIASNWLNPVVAFDQNKQSTENNHFQGNIYLQVKPIHDIALKTVYGMDYLNIDNSSYTSYLLNTTGGSSSATLNKNKRWVWTSTGEYSHIFGGKHDLDFLVGTEQQYTYYYGFGLSRSAATDDYYTNINGGYGTNASTNTDGNRGENYLVSIFSRLAYTYDKKYILGASYRRDGYSAFAPGKKYGNFWSASVAYDITKENFWHTAGLDKVFGNFRIRSSYGTVGNVSGIGNYASASLYSSTLYNTNAALVFNQAGNPNLTWETSKKFDVGLEFSLFDNVLSTELSYYNNNVDGLILNLTQSASTGLPNSIPTNVGSLYNRGLEASFNVAPKMSGPFTWHTNFNFTYNKNMVTSLDPSLTSITVSTSSLETDNIIKEGYALGMLYLIPTDGVDPATGLRIFLDPDGKKMTYNFLTKQYLYADGTAGTAPTRVMSKNTMPKFYGGWTNNFRYGNFDLNVLVTYQLGFYVYNGSRATGLDNRSAWNNIEEVMNRWQKAGDITVIPKVVAGDNVSNGSANPITQWAEKGDFAKLKNVSLGYNFNNAIFHKIGISNARFYVSAQNLAIVTGYTGPDPEVSSNGNGTGNQGIDKNSVPNARTYTVGLNIGF